MVDNDLLAGFTNQIPLDKDPICDGIEDTYSSEIDNLKDGISSSRNKFDELRRQFDEFFANRKSLNLEGKLNAFSKLKGLINDNMTVNSGNANGILECLGASAQDLLGFDLGKLLRDPNIDFSKYPSTITDQLIGFVKSAYGSILDAGELSIMDSIGELEGLLDTDVLDSVLRIFGCLANHCSPPTNLPSDLDIEKQLEEAGYTISGDVDLGQTNLEQSHREYINAIKSAKNDVDNTVVNKVKRIF